MRNKILILLLITLFSCGSRKKTSDSEKNVQNENSQLKTSTDSKTESERNVESEQTSTYKINSDDTDIAFRSINGNTVFFNLFDGKNTLKAETNGEILFSKKAKNEEGTLNKKEKITEKIKTTYKIETTYKTHTTYKTILKHKDSESKRSSFGWYGLFFLIGLIFIPGIKLIFKRWIQ